ncbi:MAG: hypothetical protein CME60_03845 [Halobacteriovoraceae bacterium]|nr:hypothetical protein [Halobacteriovoraceae bacterium]|tara:strand:+ start:955 stop:1602 length:648 start_codon:yes stop_codon:yes gene_type:complete
MMSDVLFEIENPLLESLKESELKGITIDLLEGGLDDFIVGITKSDTLREIPVLKTIVAALKAGMSYNDKILVKKMASFLYELRDSSPEERRKMISDLENVGYSNKVGEKLLLILDKADDMKKPKLLGIVFKKYLEGKIDIETLLRISNGVTKIDIIDLEELKRYYIDIKSEIRPESVMNLATSGFVDFSPAIGGRLGTNRNNLGIAFVNILRGNL